MDHIVGGAISDTCCPTGRQNYDDLDPEDREKYEKRRQEEEAKHPYTGCFIVLSCVVLLCLIWLMQNGPCEIGDTRPAQDSLLRQYDCQLGGVMFCKNVFHDGSWGSWFLKCNAADGGSIMYKV